MLSQKKCKRLGLCVFLLLVVFAISLMCHVFFYGSGGYSTGPQLSEKCAGCIGQDVVGDLGGIKVRIPKHCAEYVEYDGDPGFGEGERRGGKTFESKFRSFGLDVRLPEMKCKESAEMEADYRSSWLDENSPWVSVGINSGEIYPGVEAVDRHSKITIRSLNKKNNFWLDNYERIPGATYGLHAYVVAGTDPGTGGLARENERAKDRFFHYDKFGVADTYISCGKTYVPGGVATCLMKFNMEPDMRVLVNVRFSRSLLPKWRDIRSSVAVFLSGFRVAQ